MKLLTLNTHSLVEGDGEKQVSILTEAILAERFDVIALQEVNQDKDAEVIGSSELLNFSSCTEEISIRRGNFAHEVVKTLAERGENYAWNYLPIKIGYGKYEEGLAFLCRTPIIAQESEYLTVCQSRENWKTRRSLAIRCEGSDAWFFNLHMGWWQDDDEPFFLQWVRLLRQLTEKEKYWLMGDFNAPAETRGEGYDLLRESGLYDAYEMANVRSGKGTAGAKIDGWRGRSTEREWLRIDQIWSNRPKLIAEYRTLFDGKNYVEISDHFGVAVYVMETNSKKQIHRKENSV